MSDYESIHGTRIKYLTSDPTLDSTTEGQVWYNSTTGANKSLVQIKAWSSGGDIATPRRYLAGCGLQTSALAFGGLNPGSNLNSTEEYSGASWATGGNLGTAVARHGGAGTQTAGLSFGGQATGITAQTEEYDGSSWTTGGAMNTARSLLAGAGLQTAGLAFGGNEPALSNKTEEYDGSSWTASGTLNTARKSLAGCGTQTAGLAFGGTPGSGNLADTEEYNGSSWTASNDLNTAGNSLAGAGAQDNALAFAGSGRPTATEEYDGTNWTTSPATLADGRRLLGGAGTRAAGLGFGGYGVPVSAKTEEYNSNINAITQAAWASIANFPDSRAYSGGSGGTPTSTLVFGGYDGPGLGGFLSTGAEFNGSSWTATGDYVIDVVGVGGLGPVTAGLGCGGYKDNATNVTTCAEYDGSSWTSGNSANVAGQAALMAGVQTAASMGNRSGDNDGHEQYDGTNWTVAANTPVSGGGGSMMAGTQTALLMYGAEQPGVRKRTEEWNGSSWTSGNNMSLDRRLGSHGGTQTYAIAGGGDSNPGIFGNTELWDGTSWASSASMGTARFYQVGGTSVGSGGVTSNIAATGRTPGSTHSNNCEEFTGGTSVTTASTLTTS